MYNTQHFLNSLLLLTIHLINCVYLLLICRLSTLSTFYNFIFMNAYCHLSIIPVRKSPEDSSEMVNQLLYGEEVLIENENDNWYFVQSILDGYKGWVDKKQIVPKDDINQIYLVTQPIFKYSNAMIAQKLFLAGSFLGKNDVLLNEKENSINKGISFLPILKDKYATVDIAHKFLNAPYLWGGKSVFGIDCSGLTQIAFRLAGINILRDASQQATMGANINEFNNIENGDLAFFNKGKNDKVTHVGIVIKKEDSFEIIHASGQVKIETLTQDGIVDSFGNLTHQYLFTQRIVE